MLTITTPPAIEPVTVQRLASQLRLPNDALDAETNELLADYLATARETCEVQQGRSYITQTLRLVVEKKVDPRVAYPIWTGVEYLPDSLVYAITSAPQRQNTVYLLMPPVQQVLAVQAIRQDGTAVTLTTSQYAVNLVNPLPQVNVLQLPEDTRYLGVDYKAGYGDAADAVPRRSRLAIILLASIWYEHRTPLAVNRGTDSSRLAATHAELPFGVSALLDFDRANFGAL